MEAAVPTREQDQDAAARLEAALERIARSAERVREPRAEPDPRVGEIVSRLEALITTLKEALEEGVDG